MRDPHVFVPNLVMMAGAQSSSERGSESVAVAPPKTKKPWNVVLYNDDDHTFGEVELQLQRATGCSQEVAQHIARLVDREGKAVCYTGERSDCERVAGILRQIDLLVEIEENT